MGKFVAGKLAALIGVEDLRRAVSDDGLLDGLDAKIAVQCIGDAPGQHFAAMPIHLHKAAVHRDVGDIGGPGLVGAVDGQVAQPVGVNFVLGMTPCRLGSGIDGLQSHPAHQTLDPFAIYPWVSVASQQALDRAAADSGIVHEQLVDPAHQFQVLFAGART